MSLLRLPFRAIAQVVFFLAVLTFNIFAAPVDIQGDFLWDTTVIDNFSKSSDSNTTRTIGSMAIPRATSDEADASFQTYIFRLRPTVIVNDSVTVFTEITTGYASGGYLGQGAEQAGNNTGGTLDQSTTPANKRVGNTLFNYNTYRDGLNLRQAYAKYYADTATFIVGRQPLHWGLGVLYNSGPEVQNRHASIEDGITAELNIGSFQFAPFYMKVNSGADLDSNDDTRSTGIRALYSSSDRDLEVGILYALRRNKDNSTQYVSGPASTSSNVNVGSIDIKQTDIYFRKGFGKFDLALEAPILDGDIGNVYSTSVESEYKASAIITEASYELNKSWSIQFNAGTISGDEGPDSNAFEAFYLHPNYQIAHLMFRYNLFAVDSTQGENIFDSSVTNATFLKLGGTYKTEKWTWNLAFIWAKANEVFEQGSGGFQHELNETVDGASVVESQDDNLGFEVDVDFAYDWNSNVKITGSIGYHVVGDYYAFDNNASTEIALKDSYAAQLATSISF